MDHLRMMRQCLLTFALIHALLLTQTAFAGDRPGSLGIQVVPISTGELAVLHVIDDSPAMQSGLLPGDLIIEVGQLSMRGSDFDQVTKSSLWGEVGTEVALVWLRPGAADKMQATIRRVAITDKLKIKRIPGVEIRTPN